MYRLALVSAFACAAAAAAGAPDCSACDLDCAQPPCCSALCTTCTNESPYPFTVAQTARDWMPCPTGAGPKSITIDFFSVDDAGICTGQDAQGQSSKIVTMEYQYSQLPFCVPFPRSPNSLGMNGLWQHYTRIECNKEGKAVMYGDGPCCNANCAATSDGAACGYALGYVDGECNEWPQELHDLVFPGVTRHVGGWIVRDQSGTCDDCDPAVCPHKTCGECTDPDCDDPPCCKDQCTTCIEEDVHTTTHWETCPYIVGNGTHTITSTQHGLDDSTCSGSADQATLTWKYDTLPICAPWPAAPERFGSILSDWIKIDGICTAQGQSRIQYVHHNTSDCSDAGGPPLLPQVPGKCNPFTQEYFDQLVAGGVIDPTPPRMIGGWTWSATECTDPNCDDWCAAYDPFANCAQCTDPNCDDPPCCQDQCTTCVEEALQDGPPYTHWQPCPYVAGTGIHTITSTQHGLDDPTCRGTNDVRTITWKYDTLPICAPWPAAPERFGPILFDWVKIDAGCTAQGQPVIMHTLHNVSDCSDAGIPQPEQVAGKCNPFTQEYFVELVAGGVIDPTPPRMIGGWTWSATEDLCAGAPTLATAYRSVFKVSYAGLTAAEFDSPHHVAPCYTIKDTLIMGIHRYFTTTALNGTSLVTPAPLAQQTVPALAQLSWFDAVLVVPASTSSGVGQVQYTMTIPAGTKMTDAAAMDAVEDLGNAATSNDTKVPGHPAGVSIELSSGPYSSANALLAPSILPAVVVAVVLFFC